MFRWAIDDAFFVGGGGRPEEKKIKYWHIVWTINKQREARMQTFPMLLLLLPLPK
jgi:hypothetical protein